MGADLTGYTKVFTENFKSGLSAYDGQSGVWSTGTRRDALQTNSNKSVFLDGTQVTSDGEMVGVTPFSVDDGVLSIGSGVLKGGSKAAVKDVLQQTGEGASAGTADYYTGLISTDDTWGQTYGYFEAEIQVPEGQGHWSAFWLKPAGEGWPPETTFEMYGRGQDGDSTYRDNSFTTSVIFNKENNEDPSKTNDVNIENFYVRVDGNGNILYNPDGSFDTVNGTPQQVTKKADGTYRFVSHTVTTDGGSFELNDNRVKQHLGLTEDGDGTSIYDTFWTYGIQWTPDTITFWFGPDKDNMEIVFQAPTTDDHHVPMTLMLNDQIGTTSGWWDPVLDENGNPQDGMFGPDNSLKIKSVSVYMMDPENRLTGRGDGGFLYDGDEKTTITGTAGNDWVVTGQGEDVIHLKGGADTVWADRGKDNKIISGFDADDVLVLEGYNIENAKDALSRLTQVGNDVWLSNGSYPTDPQTIVFRDMKVSEFSAENFVVRWSETPNIWASHLRDSTFQNEAGSDGFQHARQGWVDLNGDGVIQNDPSAAGYELTGVGTRFYYASGSKGMVGSAEGDVYYGVKTGTVIVEQENGGIDTVYSSNSFVLADNVENLTSTFKDISGTGKTRHFTGNGQDNRMTGNTGSEVFEGAGGDDLIDLSQGGSDRVIFGRGDGHDVIDGFGKGDKIEIDDFVFRDWAGLKSRMSNWGDDVRIDLGAGHSILLRDVHRGDLKSSQFVFDKGEEDILGTGIDPWVRPSETADQHEMTMTTEQWLNLDHSEMTSPELKSYFDDVIATSPDSQRHTGSPGVLVVGDRSADYVLGSRHSDAYLLNGGSDTVRAGGSDDFVFSGSGSDVLLGNFGGDVLRGGNGSDTLRGHNGDDVLWGENGRDKLVGGQGADVFLLRPADRHQDAIVDFSLAEGDRIAIDTRDGDFEILLRQQGNAVKVIAKGEDGLDGLAQVRNADLEDVQAAITLGWDLG